MELATIFNSVTAENAQRTPCVGKISQTVFSVFIHRLPLGYFGHPEVECTQKESTDNREPTLVNNATIFLFAQTAVKRTIKVAIHSTIVL